MKIANRIIHFFNNDNCFENSKWDKNGNLICKICKRMIGFKCKTKDGDAIIYVFQKNSKLKQLMNFRRDD